MLGITFSVDYFDQDKSSIYMDKGTFCWHTDSYRYTIRKDIFINQIYTLCLSLQTEFYICLLEGECWNETTLTSIINDSLLVEAANPIVQRFLGNIISIQCIWRCN